MTGTLSLVLHAHLPFVRHPEQEHFLEENWYYEALFESYLPLLSAFEGLEKEGVPFRLALSISPTLLSMVQDPLLSERALRYLDDLTGLAEREASRPQDPALQKAARFHLERWVGLRKTFQDSCQGDLSRGFKKFQRKGNLELLTCAATHGYLPLLSVREEAVRAQVETALKLHRSVFGESRGFWLPECGYQPGLEKVLGDLGVRYFFLESHGVLQALPRPPYGTFAPVLCPNGVAAFGRDQESSRQVWSSKEGYPGHPDYREFYRDVGFDRPEGELAPFVKPVGIRRFTGLKLHRVTGPTDQKEPYDPERALARAREHAGDFLASRRRQLEEAARWMDRPPHLSCLYDAELFGHWWFEGPDFLKALFERNHREGGNLSFVTPSEALEGHPPTHRTQPVFSSWGVGGYSEFWLNDKNDWIYPPLHQAGRELSEVLGKIPNPKGAVLKALQQAARELLLAQSSDWAFMMRTGSHRAYAEARFKIHLNRFERLLAQARAGKVDLKFLAGVEEKDDLFPDIDLRPFKKA